MKQTNPGIRVITRILVYNLLLGVAVVALGLYQGWTTPFQFGGGLFLGGIVLIGVGVLSIMGHWKTIRDLNPMTTGSANVNPGLKQKLLSAFNFAVEFAYQIPVFLAGLVAVVIGSVVQTYF